MLGQHFGRDVDGHHHFRLALQELHRMRGEVDKHLFAGLLAVTHHAHVAVALVRAVHERLQVRMVLGRRKIGQFHGQQRFTRIAVKQDGSVIHGDEFQGLPVIHSHGLGMLQEQVTDLQIGGLGVAGRPQQPLKTRAHQENQTQ